MARLEIPSASGHDVIEFDKAKGLNVEAAMAKFNELVGTHKMLAATRNEADPPGQYRKPTGFSDLDEVTTFKVPMTGG